MQTGSNEGSGYGAPVGQTEAPSKREEIENSLYRLEFRGKCAARYCQNRCNKFELLNMLSVFLTVLSGSAAVGSALSNNHRTAIVAGIITAIIFAANSSIGFSRRSEKYSSLFQRFNDLATKARAEPSDQLLATLSIEMENIQKGVPATLRVLDVVCHNQEVIARGRNDESTIYYVDCWHWLWKDVWTFEGWQPKTLAQRRGS